MAGTRITFIYVCRSTPRLSSSRLSPQAGADPPQFVKDDLDAFPESGILACGFLRQRCDDCGHDKLGLQLQAPRLLPVVRVPAHGSDGSPLGPPCHPPCGVRWWVLSLPIPLR